MIAVGLPGQLPRCWVDGSLAVVAAQLREGEVASAEVELDESGYPIAKPLPAPSHG